MNQSLGKMQRFFFYVIVFFVVFDGVRSNLVISNLIAPLRELALALFIALCYPMLSHCKIKDMRMAIPLLIISALAIVNIPITLFHSISAYNLGKILVFGNPYSAVYKHIIFGILFLAMICYARKKTDSVRKGLKIFINLSAVYSIITVPIYIYGAPLFVEKFRDWGRMGVGYPTMDGQVICLAIFCLIFLIPQKSKISFNIKMAALLLGLVCQNTGTSMVTMLMIAVVAMIKKPGKTISYFAVIFPAIVAIAIKQYYSDPEFFTQMLYVTTNKINLLIDPSANYGQVNTLEMRDDQYKMLTIIIDKNLMLWFFGVGGEAYVENEFKLTLASYGIFSFISFVASFFWISMLILMSKNKNKIILLVLMVFWAFTSYTLASIFLFATSCGFCIVFAYAYVSGLDGYESEGQYIDDRRFKYKFKYNRY
ncbi:TPA: hypothetical protein MBS28_003226 [Klebsiella aerogenes]|nr:hypothetical protein [Klebsiella aerogenes]